jgi:segregation and condensation protein A
MDGHKIKISEFEGPLDLLLYLIRQQRLDISVLSIAEVADQYLKTLANQEQNLDPDSASEFLLMAATLAYHKSKRLLPEDQVAEAEEVEEESLESIRLRLLMRNGFREAARELEARDRLGRDVFRARVDVFTENGAPYPARAVEADLFDLLSAYRNLMREHDKPAHGCHVEVLAEEVRLLDRMHEIFTVFQKNGRKSVSIRELCNNGGSKQMRIVTFLAILELAKLQVIRTSQDNPFGEIEVCFLPSL